MKRLAQESAAQDDSYAAPTAYRVDNHIYDGPEL